MSSVPSSFDVSSSSGVLASWLGTSTAAVNTVSILGGNASSRAGGALTALVNQSSTANLSTAQALSAGKLTTTQQRVLSAVGSNKGPLSIPWNANGTEPTVVAELRTAGWLKLDNKVITNGKPTGGTYELTAVGKAIYLRTNGGQVGSSSSSSQPLTAAQANGTTSASTASIDAALKQNVSALTSILGAVGISV